MQVVADFFEGEYCLPCSQRLGKWSETGRGAAELPASSPRASTAGRRVKASSTMRSSPSPGREIGLRLRGGGVVGGVSLGLLGERRLSREDGVGARHRGRQRPRRVKRWGA